MEISGEVKIPFSQQSVWDALNNPEILKSSLPGCEAIEKISDVEFTAKISTKLGPVRAKFNAKVNLSDLDPPNSYKISGEGQGGPAGFASGSAAVSLSETDGETLLSYNAEGNVGGKLAQVGSRLIESASRKLADEFFKNFADTLTAQQNGAESRIEKQGIQNPEVSIEKNVSKERKHSGIPFRVWTACICAAAIILILALTL
tara:strand:- start:23774 stop:24382 length:609 start_codon:yes stop_codon:yes gene_type:complete